MIAQSASSPRPPAWASILERLWADRDPNQLKLTDMRQHGPIIEGRDCWVYRAEASAYDYPLALKLYKPNAIRPFPIQQQMRRHRAFAEAMGEGGFTVPKPVACFPHKMIVLMEWIEAPSVRDMLRSMLLKRDVYRDVVRRSGAWLGAFHRAAAPKSEPLSVASLFAGLEHRVNKSHPGIVDDPVFAAADRTIRELAPLADGREMEHVDIHGDFTPSNLLIEPGRTVGIDFGANRRMPHYYDICRFLVHLEAQRPAPKWFGSLPDNFALEAFLDGYGERAPPPGGDIMNYMMLIEVLRRWAAVGAARGNIPMRVLRTIETRRLRAMATALTRALS